MTGLNIRPMESIFTSIPGGPASCRFGACAPTDGKWMVILTHDKSVTGHPPNKDVSLRLMSREDGKMSVLAKLFGGQGTMNVPSWSPDSKRLAFVSYELADTASKR